MRVISLSFGDFQLKIVVNTEFFMYTTEMQEGAGTSLLFLLGCFCLFLIRGAPFRRDHAADVALKHVVLCQEGLDTAPWVEVKVISFKDSLKNLLRA